MVRPLVRISVEVLRTRSTGSTASPMAAFDISRMGPAAKVPMISQERFGTTQQSPAQVISSSFVLIQQPSRLWRGGLFSYPHLIAYTQETHFAPTERSAIFIGYEIRQKYACLNTAVRIRFFRANKYRKCRNHEMYRRTNYSQLVIEQCGSIGMHTNEE